MATRLLRSLITTANQTLTPRFNTTTTTTTSVSILRIRPLVAAATNLRHASLSATSIRAFSTRQTTSSLKDSNPNWSNRPPKETILLDGCDFEHWLVVMETPEGEPTRDEIIDSYINTLAKVVGSYDEARMKIYSVSTRCYYAFGALVSEELSYKLKELPGVRWVLPDSYLDVKNKDYGGEPFIDGKAVPYDPKYHAEWIRNKENSIKRNARPRNDRPRNFERRRENIQNNRLPPGGTMGGPPRGPSNAVAPPPSGNVGMQQGGGMRGPPNAGAGQSNWGAPHPSYNGGPSNNNTGGWMPPPNNNTGGGVPPPNNNTAGWMPPNGPSYQQPQRYGPNNGGAPYKAGPRPNGPGYQQPQRYAQNNGSAPYQAGPGPNGYAPNGGGGKPYQNQDIQGRDMPAPPNYSQNYQ